MSKFAMMSEEQIEAERIPTMHKFGAGLANFDEGVFVVNLSTMRACKIYCSTIDRAVIMAREFNRLGHWPKDFEEKSITHSHDHCMMAKV